MRLDADRAQAALRKLGEQVGMSAIDVAYGIHRIGNATMMRALSSVSSERGLDPSSFSLLAMGGNGGVHAGDLAETLGIVRVVVPPAAGLFSALGLLAADVEHQSIRAFYRALAEVRPEDMAGTIGPMIEEVEALLARSGFGTAGSRSIEVLLELKYAGQGSTLSLHVPHERLHAEAVAALSGDFDAEHLRQYGYHSPREPKRCVAIKVVGRGLAETPRLPEAVRRRLRPGGGEAAAARLFRRRARLARHPDRHAGRLDGGTSSRPGGRGGVRHHHRGPPRLDGPAR
jgi:N-methylhydantoinase A